MIRRKIVIAVAVLGFMLSWGVAYAQEDDAGDALLDFLKSIHPSFYVDLGYTYNFNDPESADGGVDNDLRIFDIDHNELDLHLIEIALERTPTTEGGLANLVGFRVDLDFGEDASLFDSAGLGDGDDEFDLQQAYINILAPIGNGLNIYAGKFVTLAGAEVIESKDNFNFSRSYLFGFAIPFAHTGVRARYSFGPLGFILGVNNGWDVVDDPNDGKTIEAQVALTAGIFSAYVTGYFGPEQAEDDSDWRELIDVVVSITPMEKLILLVNADFAWEQDVNFETGEDSVNWYGVAGYIVYDFSDVLRLALRAEYFVDDDGFRTGTEQDLFEVTPTLSIKPFAGKGGLDNLVLRLEYRFDRSDEDTFEDDDGSFKDTQHTIATELLYYFSL